MGGIAENSAGGALLAGGGAAMYRGVRSFERVGEVRQLDTFKQALPFLNDLQSQSSELNEFVIALKGAMDTKRVPGQGLLHKVPFAGKLADKVDRVARLWGMVEHVSSLDETSLANSGAKFTEAIDALSKTARAEIPVASKAVTGHMMTGGKWAMGGMVAAFTGIAVLAAANID